MTLEAAGIGECETARDSCIAGDATCELQTADCDATVAELETCLADEDASLRQTADMTCETTADEVSAIERPASCDTLLERCPKVFGED